MTMLLFESMNVTVGKIFVLRQERDFAQVSRSRLGVLPCDVTRKLNHMIILAGRWAGRRGVVGELAMYY